MNTSNEYIQTDNYYLNNNYYDIHIIIKYFNLITYIES